MKKKAYEGARSFLARRGISAHIQSFPAPAQLQLCQLYNVCIETTSDHAPDWLKRTVDNFLVGRLANIAFSDCGTSGTLERCGQSPAARPAAHYPPSG